MSSDHDYTDPAPWRAGAWQVGIQCGDGHIDFFFFSFALIYCIDIMHWYIQHFKCDLKYWYFCLLACVVSCDYDFTAPARKNGEAGTIKDCP